MEARYQNINILQLEAELTEDDSIGCCIGLVENNNCWKFLIYLGDQNIIVAYEKGVGIIKDSFDYLYKNLEINNFGKNHENTKEIISLNNLKINQPKSIFYKYDLNLFKTFGKNCKTSIDLLKTIESNLNEIEMLEVGDIIMFERGLYHHSALLIDNIHMLCIHRSGEPDDPGNIRIASSSILGIPTEKASVTEDHLIEIAGFSILKKSNEIYDKKYSPKTKEEIVIEATKRLGEKGYSVTSQNCQHFASSCRNGTEYSHEVQQVVDGAFYSGFFGIMSLVLAIASKYFVSSKKRIESGESKK